MGVGVESGVGEHCMYRGAEEIQNTKLLWMRRMLQRVRRAAALVSLSGEPGLKSLLYHIPDGDIYIYFVNLTQAGVPEERNLS